MGFAACMALGIMLNIIVRTVVVRAEFGLSAACSQSWFVIFKPLAFAVIFTFGNIISLSRHAVCVACFWRLELTLRSAQCSCAAPRSSFKI